MAEEIQKIEPGTEFANAILPADFPLTGETQIGVVVEYVTSAGPGQLVITQLPLGEEGAIFITAPLVIKGASFKALLEKKGVDLTTEGPKKTVGDLLTASQLSLDAFYYGPGESQPMIVSVSVKFGTGVIDALVNGPPPAASADQKTKDAYEKASVPVSTMFDITGGSVRIVKCKEIARPKLTAYLATLQR